MSSPIQGPKGAGNGGFLNVEDTLQKDIRARLARIEGQIKGLMRQLDSGKSCDGLLIQASAIRAAMTGVMVKLVEAHIDTCVKNQARRGAAEEALEDLKVSFTTALRQV